MSDRRCDRCEFWKIDARFDGYEGQCRRSPPTHEGWAETFNSDWCGEFKDKGEENDRE